MTIHFLYLKNSTAREYKVQMNSKTWPNISIKSRFDNNECKKITNDFTGGKFHNGHWFFGFFFFKLCKYELTFEVFS
jgi:hypothetical protein